MKRMTIVLATFLAPLPLMATEGEVYEVAPSIENSGNDALLGSSLANDDSIANVSTDNSINTGTVYTTDINHGVNGSTNNNATSDNSSASAVDGSLAVTANNVGNDNLNTTTTNSGNSVKTDNSNDSDVLGIGSASVANNGGVSSLDKSDNSDESEAEAEYNSAAANNGSVASADNSDNSIENEAEASYGSAAANGGSTATADNSDNSKHTDNSDNSGAEAVYSSAAANNGGTATIDNSVELGDNALNASSLRSTVAENRTSIGARHADQDASNEIGGSFGSAAGISVAAQNLGQSSAVQQSVNVQANLGSSAGP